MERTKERPSQCGWAKGCHGRKAMFLAGEWFGQQNVSAIFMERWGFP